MELDRCVSAINTLIIVNAMKLEQIERVMPALNYSEQRINTPIVNIITIFMQTAGSNATRVLVELLNFGLAGPASIPVSCSIDTDVAKHLPWRSTILATSHYTMTLV